MFVQLLLVSIAVGVLSWLSPLLTAPFTRYAWTITGFQVVLVLSLLSAIFISVIRFVIRGAPVLSVVPVLADAILAYSLGLTLFVVAHWIL